MVMGLFTSCATQRAKYVTYVPDSAVVFEAIKAEIQYLDIPKDYPIEVLSMYDGIATGRYCLEKLGYTNVTYKAYEIDKYIYRMAH